MQISSKLGDRAGARVVPELAISIRGIRIDCGLSARIAHHLASSGLLQDPFPYDLSPDGFLAFRALTMTAKIIQNAPMLVKMVALLDTKPAAMQRSATTMKAPPD